MAKEKMVGLDSLINEKEGEKMKEGNKSKKKSIYELLEEEINALDLSEIEKNIKLSRLLRIRNQKVNIMLVGATGVGKSSTINALFDMEVAKVGVGVDPETSNIVKYELENLTIWDTPGLLRIKEEVFMIPLIIGGGLGLLVTGATGIVSVAGQSVCKDLRSEIEGINRQSQRMIDDTRELIQKTNDEEEKAYKKLINQRKRIYNTTFKKAEELTKKIRAKDKSPLKHEISVFEGYMPSVDYSIETSANISSRVISGIGIAFGMPGFCIGTIVSGVALEFKKDEALANKEKVRAECELAKLECTKIKNVTIAMNDSYKIIKTLDSLTKRFEDYIEEVFAEKRDDLSNWTDDEIEALRTMFNFLKALSDIINVEIITEKGNISSKYKKLIGEAELLGDEYE